MLISSWMLLGLKECIKVPKGTLNEVVGWHLSKSDNKVDRFYFMHYDSTIVA